MSPKITNFLMDVEPATPCLVVDLDVVADRYRRLRQYLPMAQIYYAVKANPALPVLETLVREGSNFDAASLPEIRQCLAAGGRPEGISFGNTIKRRSDIISAVDLGIDLFAFDSEAELKKLAEEAPRSKVFCRILLEQTGAAWPLGRKFGCHPEMVVELMIQARNRGLVPHGISFHVGSQQTHPEQWDVSIGQAALVFASLEEQGIEVKMLNLGGGFPVSYRDHQDDLGGYSQLILRSLSDHFGNRMPEIIVEPGRYVCAEAGMIQTEVLLISRKSKDDETRWVYVDAGKFGGLAETMDEAIQYPITTPKDGGETGPVCIAGPTCDGADTLYENAGYRLPQDLEIGDKLCLLNTGAYTSTYASIGFNGFAPLAEHYI